MKAPERKSYMHPPFPLIRSLQLKLQCMQWRLKAKVQFALYMKFLIAYIHKHTVDSVEEVDEVVQMLQVNEISINL